MHSRPHRSGRTGDCLARQTRKTDLGKGNADGGSDDKRDVVSLEDEVLTEAKAAVYTGAAEVARRSAIEERK